MAGAGVRSPLRSVLKSCSSLASSPAAFYSSASLEPAAAAVSVSSGESSGTRTESSKRYGWSVLLLFLPGAATFGLGTWQMFRRQWKVDMLEYRRDRLQEDPIPVSESVSPDGVEYRQVVCRGTFDDDKSLFIGPRSRVISGVTQKGFILVTPLHPVGGDSVQPSVLVNRGWVPSSWQAGMGRRSKVEGPGTEAEVVSVRGVVRSSEQPNMFVPPNDVEAGQWFYIDVPAMAAAVGLPQATTLLIEAVQGEAKEEGGGRVEFPIPKSKEALLQWSVMPQDHVNYALTWYSLCAATTYMAVKRLRLERRVMRR